MTTDHDPDPNSDPDATVKLPRPAEPKKGGNEGVDVEEVDPDSTLVREDWSSTTLVPHPPLAAPAQQEWEQTLRRPAYTPDQK